MRGNHFVCPIICSNVIEFIVNHELREFTDKEQVICTVRTAFQGLQENKIEAFVQHVTVAQTYEYTVRTRTETFSVPWHTSVQIEC